MFKIQKRNEWMVISSCHEDQTYAANWRKENCQENWTVFQQYMKVKVSR